MKIMVSACLIGEKCKYNGKDNYNEKVVSYINGNDIIPVCPELAGGLAVPRYPCEIVGGHIIDSKGQNLDIEFNEGSLKCVKIATEEKIDNFDEKSKIIVDEQWFFNRWITSSVFCEQLGNKYFLNKFML